MVFQLNDELQKFIFDLIYKLNTFKWGDISWGYEKNILYWYNIVEFAKKRIRDDLEFEEYDLVLSLADVDKSNIWRVSEALYDLAKLDYVEPESSKSKFVYLSLVWAYENRHTKYKRPLDAVSDIFATFGCPDEISHFVPFLPPTDGYDPSKYSTKKNLERLYNFWRQYLYDHGYQDKSHTE
jgi:hypothetical protein